MSRRYLDGVTVAAGIIVLVLLLIEIGFAITPAQQALVLLAVKLGLWLALLGETLRILLHRDRSRYVRRHPLECVMTILLLLLLIGQPVISPLIFKRWIEVDPARVQSLYLGGIQVLILGGLSHRVLRFNQLLAFARVSPRAILIGSYLGLILTGAAFLKLPRATVEPGALGWLDALFTSTSAVCVTGLIVVDTATVFSEFGQVIVLVLLQLGGLGLMTFTYFFVSVFGGGITIRDRAILLDFLNEEHVGQITGSLIAIIVMTFLFEAAGAVLLQTALQAAGQPAASWFDSIFHAVSAFCNAGFSVYTDGLFDPATRTNLPYQAVIMVLIVVGGLGFPVLKNLWDHVQSRLRHPRHRPTRITTHTKIVLSTTGALIGLGTAAIWVLEYALTDQPAHTSKVATSLFLSISSRTAGFNTVAMDALMPGTLMVTILLMFVGGSPASTAGGIKTTTFAVALMNTLRILRNSTGDLVAFGRQIPDRLANRAFAISLLAIAWVAATTVVLALSLPQHAPIDLLFEAVSAFGTVGLSRGITPQLPPFAKVMIIGTMIVGRIGILYVALGVLGKEQRGSISYPQANVIIS